MKKTKILVPALLSIAACGAIVAGSTYALFTSEAKTNVAITSGKVDVKASVVNGVDGLTLTHQEWDDATNAYVEKEGLYGGSASLDADAQTLTISKLVPMDKIAFQIEITNNSNVAIQYRTVLKSVEDSGLFDGLKISIDGDEFDGVAVKTNYETWASSGSKTIDVSIEMPEVSSNAYQDKSCKISYAVEAIQGNALTDIHVTKDNIQDYLDGKYGSLNDKTLILAAGDYDQIDLGRPSKYAGSNTEYRINGFDADAKTYDAFASEISSSTSFCVPYYTRTISGLTLRAEEGATVKIAGLSTAAGQVVNGRDYVLERDVVSGSNTYYYTVDLSDIAFEGITFTSKVDINSAIEQTKISKLIFSGCAFAIGNTAAGNQAIRFYGEQANGNLKGLTVSRCTFTNCYQGVLAYNVYGTKVNASSFDTTGHNAIGIQDSGTATDHGKVIITGNTFANIGDRIIRFNAVGADTQITIKNNTATNSGDSDGQVIKASSLADGVTYDISGNNWGEGKTVANSEFEDK